MGWFFVRVFLVLAISFGVLRGLTPADLPVLGSLIAWSQSARPEFPGSHVFLWIGQNWLALALSWLLLISRAASHALDELRTTSHYIKLFMATVGNYLQLETATDALKTLKEKGDSAVIKSGISKRMLFSLLGLGPPDPYLSAWPERHGARVSLEEDIRRLIREQANRTADGLRGA